jgi:malate synthase
VLGDRPNQLERQRPDVTVSRHDLLDVASTGGEVTLEGVRTNVRISLEYLAAWVGGAGAVAIDNLMEDAATAEISRSQVWQWIHQDHSTTEGDQITRDYIEGLIAEVLSEVDRREDDRYEDAAEIFREVALGQDFPAFLTLPAYTKFLVETD